MAPAYLTPGVYIEEFDRGPRPIAGVSTSVAAFIGFTAQGPVNSPTLVNNWSQFLEHFGGFLPGAFLPFSVAGFFANGGEDCYILRMPTTKDGTSAPIPIVSAIAEIPAQMAGIGASLVVESLLDGDVAENTTVEIRDEESNTFTLIVRLGPSEEVFSGITLARKGDTTLDTINQESNLIRIRLLESGATLKQRMPIMGSYKLSIPQSTGLQKVDIDSAIFKGDVSERKGIGSLEAIEQITMISAPDLMSAFLAGAIDETGMIAAQRAMIEHCENMGDRVALLDAPPELSPQKMANWRRAIAGYDSKYASIYYPWIEIEDDSGRPFAIPPSGHIAGIFARVDEEKGVHKAPANEVIRGALGLETFVTRGEQDLLNPMGVNCIRQMPGRGIRVWGARTLSSDPAWRFINVRRLFNYVEESIREGTQWVVYEPNDHHLWGRVIRDVSSFLRKMWRNGALFGDTAEQAFFVKCDQELNPPAVRDKGQLIIEIGMAPAKPAEFIVFRISQWAGGGA